MFTLHLAARLLTSRTRVACYGLMLSLCACGGGGGSGTSPPPVTGWTAGIFQPASHFASMCQAPRSGNDPISGDPYPDAQGTTLDQNNWLRSWTNELYLWQWRGHRCRSGHLLNDGRLLRHPEDFRDDVHGAEKDRPLHLSDRAVGAAVAVRGRRGLRSELTSSPPHRPAKCMPPTCGPAMRPPRRACAGRGRRWRRRSIPTTRPASTPSMPDCHRPVSVRPIPSPSWTWGEHQPQRDAAGGQRGGRDPVPLVSTLASTTGNVGYILFNTHIALRAGADQR